MNPVELEIFCFGEIPPRLQWRMPPHRHPDCHEIIVIMDGKMSLKAEREELQAERGDVLFYHSGLLHEEVSLDSSPVRTLWFSFNRTRQNPRFPLRMQDTHGRVRQMISWLHRDLSEGADPRERRMLFSAIIEELGRLSTNLPDPWLQNVREHLRKNFADEVSVEALAGRVGLTPSAFAHKFKKLAGHSPMKELRLLRLEEARQQIATSRAPLKAIAPAVGLGDEYQLSKLFKRHFGLSPSALRRSHGLA